MALFMGHPYQLPNVKKSDLKCTDAGISLNYTDDEYSLTYVDVWAFFRHITKNAILQPF